VRAPRRDNGGTLGAERNRGGANVAGMRTKVLVAPIRSIQRTRVTASALQYATVLTYTWWLQNSKRTLTAHIF